MIRFCDLRSAYWCMDDDPEAPPQRGPFAFIDTVTDTFVSIDGVMLFDDVEHVLECAARQPTFESSGRLARCMALVPRELLGSDEATRQIEAAIQQGNEDRLAARGGR